MMWRCQVPSVQEAGPWMVDGHGWALVRVALQELVVQRGCQAAQRESRCDRRVRRPE